ncbi:MAG: hypothetical protein ACYTHK_15000 [Planctomycetota bacterium]|jgi:hypothetical protein
MIAELSSTALRWDALPPLWVVVLLIVPAVALAVRFIYRREPGAQGTPLRMGLGVLRILAVLLVLGALFGPYEETIEGEVSKRTLVVAVDTSRSMSLQDQYQRNEKLAKSLADVAGVGRNEIARLSRLDIARAVVGGDEDYLGELLDTFDLQLFSFDDELKADFMPVEGEARDDARARLSAAIKGLKAEGGITRIGSAIRTLVRRLEARNEPVAGVILLTDGRHTGGAPEPVPAAQRAADRGREGIPIYPVPIGDPSAAVNVGVIRVDAPEVVLAGDRVLFTATVHARGCAGRDARLVAHVLNAENEVEETLPIDAEPFPLPEDDAEPVKASFHYTFRNKGTYDLKIGIEPLDGEAVVSDNFRRHSLRVVELKMNVLFVVDRPSFTYRFLGEALLRAEKTIRAQTMLLSAEPNWPMMATRGLTPLRTFPRTRAELAPYDVIILQDVKPGSPRFAEGGVEAAQQTVRLLADWVKDGGGLVLQSGREMNFVTHYGSTDLPALMPVVAGDWTQDDRDRVMGGTRAKKWLEITSKGLESPILRVLEDTRRVREFWESKEYETFYYAYTPVKHAKSSATVLAARHESRERRTDPHPIVALQDYGLGKVLWLAHEEFWRMRKGFDENPNLYYWRFWSGIIRHLATYRLLGGNKRVKIWVDRANGRYKLGETIGIEAKFLDEDFNPVTPQGTGGSIRTITMQKPDGTEEELTLTAVVTDPPEGLFRTRAAARTPGTYRLIATVPGESEPAKATFVVEETTLEMRDPLVDMKTLQGIAQASRGRVLDPAQFRRLIEDQVVPPTSIVRSGEPKRTTLWDRAWVLWLFVGLLSVEWILRRLNNML